jgi:hypothetical protein
MADDYNALVNPGRVPVLQAIANPQVVNPLAAINAGNQAAETMFRVRGLQANQALGEILQQSTDANGNVDYQDAQRRAAAAGPLVQMGMQSYLTNNSNLRGAQIRQAADLHGFIADLAASGVNDPSPENIARIRAEGQSYGLPGAGLAEIDRIGAIADPEQRRTEFYKHLQARLDTVHKLATTPYALPESVDLGGGQRRSVTTTAGTPWSPPNVAVGGGVSTGPPTGSTVEVTKYFDNDGEVTFGPDGKPNRPLNGQAVPQKVVVPSTDVRGMPKPGEPLTPPGAPPVTTNTVPVTPRPGVVPGRLTRSGQPLPLPSPSEVAPSAATPDGTTPAPPSPVGVNPNAKVPIPPPAGGDNRPPAVVNPPPGQVGQIEDNVKAYTEDQRNYPNVITRAQNTAHAYDALKLLKDLDSSTGVGAAAVNTVRSRLAALGLLPQGSVNILTLKDLFAKYTEKSMLDAAGPSTNLGKEMAQKSNAGENISTDANFEVLRNNLAKDLQAAAAYKSHEDPRGYGYLSHRNLVTETDPRGFIWNTYSQPEQDKIKAEVRAQGKAAIDRLNTAIGMAHELNVQVPGATLAPPPGNKGSFLTPRPMRPPPLAPGQNPLLMTG